MDKISLTGLEIFAHHGVFDFEKENGQTFILDCTCPLDTRPAGTTDNLAASLDYGALAKRLTALFQEKTFDLIEAAAEYCARALLREYPLVRSLSLTVKKPSAPVGLPLAYPAVSITRSWTPAVLPLGSNIGDRAAELDQACQALATQPDIRLLKTSDWIETAPWGNTDQDPFLNGAVLIETLLSPQELLQTIHTIEAAQGRQRLVHWGPSSTTTISSSTSQTSPFPIPSASSAPSSWIPSQASSLTGSIPATEKPSPPSGSQQKNKKTSTPSGSSQTVCSFFVSASVPPANPHSSRPAPAPQKAPYRRSPPPDARQRKVSAPRSKTLKTS